MTVLNDLDWQRIRGHAADVARIAATRGWDAPPAYKAASEVRREALRIRDEQPAPTTPPTDPTGVESWVDDQAAANLAHRERVVVAAELAAGAERDAMREIISQVPDYLVRLAAEFDKHGKAFGRLIAEAPTQLSGNTTPAQAAAHTELLGAVEGLTGCANDRRRLAEVAGETDDYGHDPTWLTFDPSDDAYIGQVTALLTNLRDRLPATVNEWSAVAASGQLALAPLNGITDRTSRFSSACHASGMAADGGMVDKTIADALRLAVAR